MADSLRTFPYTAPAPACGGALAVADDEWEEELGSADEGVKALHAVAAAVEADANHAIDQPTSNLVVSGDRASSLPNPVGLSLGGTLNSLLVQFERDPKYLALVAQFEMENSTADE